MGKNKTDGYTKLLNTYALLLMKYERLKNKARNRKKCLRSLNRHYGELKHTNSWLMSRLKGTGKDKIEIKQFASPCELEPVPRFEKTPTKKTRSDKGKKRGPHKKPSIGKTTKTSGYMSTKEAAQYLGISEKTLYARRSSGTGPQLFKNGRIFYEQKDLDAWVQGLGVATQPQEAGIGEG